MHFYVGTSGYSYKEWKGNFYPEKLPQKEMLNYYGQHFSTVEINNTFYQMPKVNVLESWANQVPSKFQFVLKVPQKITHHKRLENIEEDVDYLQRTASVLKGRLGPLLFQFPPYFKKNFPRLTNLLDLIEDSIRIALEFRDPSWFDDEIFDCLRKKSCALCIADADDLPSPGLVDTVDWGYVRLRREVYTDKDLQNWAQTLKSKGWNNAYVFFKHEEAGTGPKLANRFLKLVAS
jgi:uncharacterized protein YecE (DUF72 family)